MTCEDGGLCRDADSVCVCHDQNDSIPESCLSTAGAKKEKKKFLCAKPCNSLPDHAIRACARMRTVGRMHGRYTPRGYGYPLGYPPTIRTFVPPKGEYLPEPSSFDLVGRYFRMPEPKVLTLF